MGLLDYCPITRRIRRRRCRSSDSEPSAAMPFKFDLTYNYVTSPIPFLTPSRLAFLRLTLAFYSLFAIIFTLVWECVKLGTGHGLVAFVCPMSRADQDLNEPATSLISPNSHTSVCVPTFMLLGSRRSCMLEDEAVALVHSLQMNTNTDTDTHFRNGLARCSFCTYCWQRQS
jgi:hypothetical protein